MVVFEQHIADVFASLETWLVSSGATNSMLQLSWAVLTFLWLAHVAVAMRPGQPGDLVAVFGRLLVAAGLLLSVGPLNQVILLVFQTLRDAGSAVLLGLIAQNYSQVVQQLAPLAVKLFQGLGPWFAYQWAIVVLVVGGLFGLFLFAIGYAVYLAILFFAHLTLLLGLFLSPLAVALLAAPGTSRWTLRWAAVIARAAILVFTVKLIHAAALYLALIVPFRQTADALTAALQAFGTDPLRDVGVLGTLLWNLTGLLFMMIIGTLIGVYAMLRSERLTGQFVEGVSFAEGILSGPVFFARAAARDERRGGGGSDVSIGGDRGPHGNPVQESWGPGEGGAQDATTYVPSRPAT
jgi:hypothetical protein